MASVVPPYHYHPPRHPGSFVPTTPRSSTSYYPSSTSTVPTSYSVTGPPSSISTSSSPRLNPGLAAARHATKTPGKLQKRARSFLKNKEETVDDVDEGFFSGPGSPPPPFDHYEHHHSHSHSPASVSVAAHRARGKIKPLLKKVSGSRSNSLDLSRSDGGLPNGVGLGIYDGAGYDSSGIEDDSPFAYRHRRNFSQTSGSSPLLVGANQTFSHPKRQLPRRGGYTPDVTQYNTSNESSDESDDEHTLDKARRNALGSKSPVPGGLRLNTGRSTPMLPTLSMTDLHQRVRTPSIQMTTPVSPVSPTDLPSAVFPSNVSQHGIKASFKRSQNKARSSLDKSVSETSPSFEASVTAARLAWEAKEEKKEEKRERKRRRSEAKEEERSRATSRCSGRGRGNSGSSNQQHWSHEADFDDDDIIIGGVIKEKVGGFDEGFDGTHASSKSRNDSRSRHGTGKRWGLSGKSEAPNTKRKRPGFKKRWLGFVVWVRIGVVRMQRRLGF